jgi:glycosyltransferase involved in cell wall biosynthesis
MRISTVIPAYNRADLIGETLRTVLSQSRPPAEVIVVDDGSTDGTADVVAGFGPAVTLLRQANAGAGAARNAGFARATGDIIHFMDSDDLSSLNHYAVQGAAIEAGADLAYGPWLWAQFDGMQLRTDGLAHQQAPLPDDLPMDMRVLSGWVTVFQPCMFRRALVEAAGPYRTDLKPSEDTEMLYRLSHHARRIVHTPEMLVLYRVHPEGQVSTTNLSKRLIDQANLWDVLDRHAAARDDLPEAVKRGARLRKLDIGVELASVDPARSRSLVAAATPFERGTRSIRKFGERLGAWRRFKTTGSRLNPIYRPGPLNQTQREQVALLGYTFA